MGTATLEPKGLEAVTADDVLRAHFTLNSIDGQLECIELDGAEGWTSPNGHPALSLMRWTTTNKAKAEEALDTVLDQFRSTGRQLEWMTGPDCDDAGITPLLASRGFAADPLPVAAMSKRLFDGDIEVPSDNVKTWLADDSNTAALGKVMARGFSVPDEVGEIYHNAYLTPNALQRSTVYGANLPESDEPVAAGYLTYLNDSSNVLLRASSVVESARGNGVYKALVHHRLYDAAKAGYKEAFVHAYSKGSRECLTGLGFRTLGGLFLHSWKPEK